MAPASRASSSASRHGRELLEHRIEDFKRGMEQFVGMFTKNYGLRLIFRGVQARTEGSTIVVPELTLMVKKNMTEEEVAEAQRQLLHTRAFVYHEGAQIIYTRMTDKLNALITKKGGAKLKSLCNVLEDARAERAVSEAYPGARETLRAGNVFLFDAIHAQNQASKEKIPPYVQLLYAFMILTGAAGPDSREHPLWMDLDLAVRQRAKKFKHVIADAVNAPSTQALVKQAIEIWEMLREEKDPEPKSEKQKDSKSEAKDPNHEDYIPEDSPKKPRDKDEEDDDDDSDNDGDEEGNDDRDGGGGGDSDDDEDEDGEGDESSDGDDEDDGDGGSGSDGDEDDDSEDDGEESDDDDGAGGGDGDDDDDDASDDEGEGDEDGGDGEDDGEEDGEDDDDDDGGAGDGDDEDEEDDGDDSDESGDDGDDEDDDDVEPDEGDGDSEAALDLGLDNDDAPSEPKSHAQVLSDEMKDAAKGAHSQQVYRVWSTESDVIAKPPAPADPREAEERGQFVRGLDDKTREIYGPMMTRLEALLKSRAHSYHVRGLESGDIDQDALYKLALGGGGSRHPRMREQATRVFKQLVPGMTLTQTAVMLSIDRSGSMGGGKDELAMMCTDIIANALNGVGVPFAAQTWSNASTSFKAMAPISDRDLYSRWSALDIHIIKDFDEPWMLVRDRLMFISARQANVDGESIWIAAQALLARKERRKVLIVLCDGLPSGSSGDVTEMLEQHLRETITRIRKLGIELYCIGIQEPRAGLFYARDPDGYRLKFERADAVYRDHISKFGYVAARDVLSKAMSELRDPSFTNITNVEQLPPALMNQLESVLLR